MTFFKIQNNLVSSLISEKQGFKFILKFRGIYLSVYIPIAKARGFTLLLGKIENLTENEIDKIIIEQTNKGI